MKKHSFYRWLRRVAMFSGIPALTMIFACCCKYGMPEDEDVFGVVVDKETHGAIPGVSIRLEVQTTVVTTDEYGEFYLGSGNCENLTFSKEDYLSKDTTLCPAVHSRMIYLEKLPEK